MDALDRLAAPARELLSRVDGMLTRIGAPEDHPLWPLVRRLRVLPGDAVAALAAVEPAPLSAAGPALRTLSGQYAQPRATPPDWAGPAAEAFTAAAVPSPPAPTTAWRCPASSHSRERAANSASCVVTQTLKPAASIAC